MSRREVVLRNALSTLLIDAGYNIFLPVFDEGIDLIAHREADGDLKLIQLKSRWTIAQKYIGRGLHIGFIDRGDWFIVPHDEMLAWPEVSGFIETDSWRARGVYHRASLSAALRERCAAFSL